MGVLRGNSQCVGASGVLGEASTGRLKVWSLWMYMCAFVMAVVSCCSVCSGVRMLEGVVAVVFCAGGAGGMRSGRSIWSACVMGMGVGAWKRGVVWRGVGGDQ